MLRRLMWACFEQCFSFSVGSSPCRALAQKLEAEGAVPAAAALQRLQEAFQVFQRTGCGTCSSQVSLPESWTFWEDHFSGK